MRKTITHYKGEHKIALCHAKGDANPYWSIPRATEIKEEVNCKRCLKIMNRKDGLDG